jgi:hypothetical protein
MEGAECMTDKELRFKLKVQRSPQVAVAPVGSRNREFNRQYIELKSPQVVALICSAIGLPPRT